MMAVVELVVVVVGRTRQEGVDWDADRTVMMTRTMSAVVVIAVLAEA